MKQSTFYAEKKAKQFLNLLQGYTKGIRLTAILILLLMGVSNVWGYTISSAKIYYDDSNSKWGANVVVAFDKSDGGAVFAMTKIDNTSLYYWTGTWGGGSVDYMRFGQTTKTYDWYGWWNDVKNTWDLSQTDKWTGVSNGWGTDINNASKMFGAESNSSGANLTKTDLASYASLNSQQTIKSAVNDADANSKATISITSYEMTGNGQVTKQTATLGTGAKDTYVNAARTATTTLTVGDVATGYQFDGWYAAKTGGTALSANKTYTYYPTAATTVYARFSIKKHTVNFGVHSSGNGTLTAKVGNTSISHGTKVNYDSEVVFTATPSTGYQIEGWYSNSACTTPIDNGTNKTYTVTITGGTNVYVKFEAIPVNSHNITYTAQGTGWTYGNSNPTTAEEGATVTFVVNPTAGYRVSVSSDGPALTGPNANNQYTFTMPTKDVKITVDAKPEQYTITLNDNGGSDGPGTVTATYLAAMPTITPPTRTGYTFNGYFDATSDGTKYYNADGSSARTWNKTSNTTLYAQWTINQYTITYGVCAESRYGDIQLNGGTKVQESATSDEINYSTKVTLTATPKSQDYKIEGWYSDANCANKIQDAGTNSEYTFTLTDNTTVYVKFADAKEVMSQVTVEATAGGTVSPSGTVDVGSRTPTTFTATPDPGYRFDHWTYGGNVKIVEGSNTHEQIRIIATGEGKLTAVFTPIYSINFFATPITAGSVTAEVNDKDINSGDEFDAGTPVIFTAAVANAYNGQCTFLRWVDGAGTVLSTSNPYTHTLDGDITVKAIFKINQYTLTFSASEGGHVSAIANNSAIASPANLDYNTSVTLTAEPDAGCAFLGWYDGNTQYSSSAVYTTTLTADRNREARFQKGTTIYLKPRSWWKSDEARLVVYTWGGSAGDKWIELEDYGCNGDIYTADIPAGYTGLKFVRLRPSTADGYDDTNNGFNFENKWDETGDLTVPTNSQNLYEITADNGNGRWTTYDAPSYKLTIQSTANGTVAVSKVGGGALANNTTIKLGDEITITFTPNDGYELSNYLINYASETEADGVYTVCGPTKIIAEFDPIAPSRTVYLRPNEDWLRDNPIMAAYAYNSTNDKDNKWYVMNTADDDYTGAYSCKIPSKYDKIIFVRLNPNGSNTTNDGFNWQNMWNQTKALTIIDKDNDATNDKKMRFAIGDKIETSGEDYGRYDGAWEENTPIWGMIANFNDWKAENAVFMGYPGKLNTVPPFTPQHAFKLYNFIYTDGKYFGNAGTMKRENSEQWWTMDVNEQANCQMKLDAKGDYIYQLRFLTVGPELRKQISVTYPEATNVYTLLYEYTIDSQTKSRMSYEIAAVAGEKLDTVSFHVLKNASPQITLLKNSERQEEPISISVESDSVYNFVLQQTDGQARLLNAANPEVYTGNYYIRTDAAAGGWNAYKQEGNRMTYSSYSDKNHNFDHYFCKWVSNEDENKNFVAHTNVKFCVANDYSHALSDELNGDEYIEKNGVAAGCIPQSANVRFAWDSHTNELSRAYISGSGDSKDRFLVLTGNDNLQDINGNSIPVGTGEREGLNKNELIFSDKQNWIYQLDVQANNQTSISLTAEYNGKVQTFFGNAKSAAEGEPMLVDVANKYHKVRMIYDFKTNNLIAAWLLDPTQNVEATHVASNMLIIREDQGVANQINFASNGNQDMEIYTAYAVMTFTKDWVKGATTRDRSEYWVSFPFDVKISDVFGFSEYGDKWIMLLYDGEARAKEGYWAESKGFWKYITNRNYTLKAGVGYVLKLNLNKMDFPNNSTDASLFFPSQGIPTIINAEPTPIPVPAHTCTIDRDNRNIYDSHWNLIGVPGYANLENLKVDKLNQTVTIENEAHNLAFYYAYDAANNSYNTSLATATFKNMHAYMVQYAGELAWTNIQGTPASIAARRNSDAEPEKAIFRLELAQGEEKADQTFVQMQQEGATADFDMNVDMTKIFNSGANIYTLVGSQCIQTAGNALPFEETIVPVGVEIAAAGEYTFRMPDGTEGMVVELIDYETNTTTTNLLLDDYTVNLPTGSNETRFALSIKPEKTATSIESTTTPSDSNIRKFIIDGKLYLQKDGMLYDAQGKLVR